MKNVVGILRSVGLDVGEIHSDFDQSDRETTLRSFKNGSLQILVATDFLSRGIDASGIKLVINYDVPNDPEDYIHRIGRTARAKTDGLALTFINRQDRRKFRNIEALMEKEVRKLPLPADVPPSQEPSRSARGQGRGGKGNYGRSRSGQRSGSGKRKPNNRSKHRSKAN